MSQTGGSLLGKGLDPRQRRQRTLQALEASLIQRESQVQPLLVVFEDLHWINSETQDAAEGARRKPAGGAAGCYS